MSSKRTVFRGLRSFRRKQIHQSYYVKKWRHVLKPDQRLLRHIRPTQYSGNRAQGIWELGYLVQRDRPTCNRGLRIPPLEHFPHRRVCCSLR